MSPLVGRPPTTPPGAGMSRRTFLALAGLAGAAVAAGCGIDPGAGAASRGNAGQRSWSNTLRIPPLDTGSVDAAGTRSFRLTAGAGRSAFRPGRPTTTWGFNGAYLGPTLRARSGERVAIQVRNDLPETTTVHWHGMHLPAVMDGTPHQPIAPGSVWTPTWTIAQPAATLWYHPHPHGDTARHVYRGLAGLWIVDDDTDPGLPREYGVDDVPLVVQDRNIDAAGSLRDDESVATWGLMGNDVLVNGTLDPHLEVVNRWVRFRVLNGSNARMYNLRFTDGRSFAVVGNDCALLTEPVEVDEIALSPAERAEIVVEFRPGETVVLGSRSGDAGIDDGEFEILQVRAASTLADNGAPPSSLPGPGPVETSAAATTRRFVLSGNSKINSEEMDMGRVDEVVPAGARERWEIENIVYSHNFHVHDASFTIVDVDGGPPPAYARGRKDTVFVGNHSTVTVAIEFGTDPDPQAAYMYHCHILEHEDLGMMGQFTVVEPGTEATAPRRIDAVPSAHHHGT